jgi:hypothetical protein
VKRGRPWRAVASYRLGPGYPPVVMGRCYRATREGLDRFVTEHEAAGCTVTVWEVQPIPEVARLTQVAAGPAG